MDQNVFSDAVNFNEDGSVEIKFVKADRGGAVASDNGDLLLPLSSSAEVTALISAITDKVTNVIVGFLDSAKKMESITLILGTTSGPVGLQPMESMFQQVDEDELAMAVDLVRSLRGRKTFKFPAKQNSFASGVIIDEFAGSSEVIGDKTNNTKPENGNQLRENQRDRDKRHFHDSTKNQKNNNGNGTHTLS